MSAFRFALQAAVPWTRRLDDVRWSVLASEPRRMRCGVFKASDGEDVPYRLWIPRRARAMLILLHGACDYSGAFDIIGPRLMRAGFAVLAYDQRGFGASPSRGRWMGEKRMIADLVEAATFCRIRLADTLPLFVIGESMGGAVAVHAAASHPEMDVAGLVLVAPGALASPLRRSIYYGILSLMRALASNLEVVVERVDGKGLAPAAAIRLLGDPMVMRSIAPELLDGVIALAHSAVDAAKDVRIPALTMVGTQDDLLRQECVCQLHRNLAGPKSWASIKGGPHLLLHWEKGSKVLRTTRRWIERHL